jgi:molybdopterin synthase catalytic subunit
MIHVAVTSAPIEPARLLERVGASADGAALLFVGTVREQNDGRAVSGMRYDAYAAMAEPVLRQIALEACARAASDRIAVEHRIGELGIGDVSVAIAVSSPHRAEAFDAARFVIEQIKQRLPVWKHEHYIDGDSQWLTGVTPPPPGP